jgi:hypothetical protein
MVATMTAGDVEPILRVTVSDARSDVDFGPVTASQCLFLVETSGQLLIEDTPDTAVVAPDGKSMTLSRQWQSGETDDVGYLWVSVVVNWAGSRPQTFPDEGAMRIDVARRPGTG